MTINKAILLCGGNGTRLAPMTTHYNKGLVPIKDKLVVDYPLELLVKMGIKHLTVILGGLHFAQIVNHIKDGKHLGFTSVNFVYQAEANGIAAAINMCKQYVEDEEHFCVLLGDNIFLNGTSLPIEWGDMNGCGAAIALYNPNINEPDYKTLSRFGVASFNKLASIPPKTKLVSIREKPQEFDSNLHHYIISGLYVFDRQFFNYFKQIKPSARSEYEITDIIKLYAQDNDLDFVVVNGIWSDCGTFESLDYVRSIVSIYER